MTIDWEEQWAQFAPNFHHGYAHIPLNNHKILKLKAGPGFGDLSHPTTRLCLLELQQWVTPHSIVLDIGCGSGILSLAASLLGAKEVIGIDIDEEALLHASKNKQYNPCPNVSFRQLAPFNFQPNLITMNMIHSEQRLAWIYPYSSFLVITSGILDTQHSEYLDFAKSQGWSLLRRSQETSWLCFAFKKS